MSVLCRAALRQPATISGRRLSNLRACGGRSFRVVPLAGRAAATLLAALRQDRPQRRPQRRRRRRRRRLQQHPSFFLLILIGVGLFPPVALLGLDDRHALPGESKLEAAVIFCVFGVTGSTNVAVVRPCLKNTVGLEGNMVDGPWSYRILSLLAVSPIYACFLLGFGE